MSSLAMNVRDTKLPKSLGEALLSMSFVPLGLIGVIVQRVVDHKGMHVEEYVVTTSEGKYLLWVRGSLNRIIEDGKMSPVVHRKIVDTGCEVGVNVARKKVIEAFDAYWTDPTPAGDMTLGGRIPKTPGVFSFCTTDTKVTL